MRLAWLQVLQDLPKNGCAVPESFFAGETVHLCSGGGANIHDLQVTHADPHTHTYTYTHICTHAYYMHDRTFIQSYAGE